MVVKLEFPNLVSLLPQNIGLMEFSNMDSGNERRYDMMMRKI